MEPAKSRTEITRALYFHVLAECYWVFAFVVEGAIVLRTIALPVKRPVRTSFAFLVPFAWNGVSDERGGFKFGSSRHDYLTLGGRASVWFLGSLKLKLEISCGIDDQDTLLLSLHALYA